MVAWELVGIVGFIPKNKPPYPLASLDCLHTSLNKCLIMWIVIFGNIAGAAIPIVKPDKQFDTGLLKCLGFDWLGIAAANGKGMQRPPGDAVFAHPLSTISIMQSNFQIGMSSCAVDI